MRISRRGLPGVLGLVLAVGLLAAPVEGQRAAESRLLRQAAALESRGNLPAAEGTLRELLERNPASSGGLFALERVLRGQGRVTAVLAPTDRFLERAPGASGVRYMKLRVLAEVDSTEALSEEASAWFALDPDDPAPYREVARLYERTLGADEALAVLRRGRGAVGDPSALALEIGDLYARQGQEERALEEWSRALEADPSRGGAVGERLAAGSEPRAAARTLVGRLSDSPGPDLRRAIALLAVSRSLEAEAGELGRAAADALSGRARRAFLAEFARRADEAAMDDLASWAYGELGDEAQSPGERRQFDERLVESSLAAGDTATALAAQRRVVASFSAGSADRRRAAARVIRLEGERAAPERLRELLASFRDEFPDAPETDALAATVAARLLVRDDVSGAATVLDGIDGPRSNLERGWILLTRGEIALGRQALLMAVPGLPPTEATGVIQFTGLLGRLSPAGVQRLARAGLRAHRGEEAQAGMELARDLDQLPSEERAPLLAEAARLLGDAGEEDEARSLWRRLVQDHPESLVAAEGALELARSLMREPEGAEEAVRVLEELITSRPGAAVVPAARRELERLRERGS